MEEFLAGMFGTSVSTERRLALFTVPERRARFFGDIPSACKVASKLSETQNVYFGMGLIQGTPTGRGKQEDIAGIAALWADVDFAGEAHAGKALPADDADFQQLLAELPLRPSLIVDSGHGRHLYWLLQEPWLFTDANDRAHAARVAKGWHEVVCNAAQRLGWSLENLGDLTRVLRLPATINRKAVSDLRPVSILDADWDRRFDINDFENFLPQETADPVPRRVAPVSTEFTVTLTPDAEPPSEKLVAAILESPTFRETWDRARSDLSDGSASGYDLSLATIAMLRGWSDNETARLILAWRRRHGMHPEKALRADYMARTLARARKATVSETSEGVDLSAFRIAGGPIRSENSLPAPSDPGPISDSLCRIPGFVSEVMDHCLETAPYPNVALAFCGALVLQALLGGRKVRDSADNRTNIYLLALAFASGGKDWPRKLNTKILHHAGLLTALGEKFASGEGIQDSLNLTPSMLFQTDEIDGLLQSINKAKDARHENIMGALLSLYSSSNSLYPMRRKAGKEAPGVIDQPCLVVYGTAVPTHYYAALSERMLTNGFFARMLIVEAGCRNPGQEARIIEPPPRILETARWWSEFSPGSGNLQAWHPVPLVVSGTEAARQLLIESRLSAEAEYSSAELKGDPVATTVWGRVHEQTRKLALIYAISENHRQPVIDTEAVEWATQFVTHQTHRMLFMAHGHVAENPFHGECLKLVRKLYEAPERQLEHSILLKRMKMDARTFQDLINTLEQQGDLVTTTKTTTGRPQRVYQLLRDSLPE